MAKTPIFHNGEFIPDFDREYVRKMIIKRGWKKLISGIILILFGIGTFLSISAGIPGVIPLRRWALIIGIILIIACVVDFPGT
jgi:hypothetical protein